jgi:hypothetical protein
MTEESEEGFNKFADAAMRSPRRKVYDQILAALLIKANSTSDPLKKIQTMCEAALFVKDKTSLDMALVESAYVVSSCLLKSEVTEDKRNGTSFVGVPWPFPKTEENYKKHVQPWQTVELRYYPFLTSYRRKHYPFTPDFEYWNHSEETEWNQKNEATTASIEEIGKLPEWQRFYIKTEVLSLESFKALKGAFEHYYLQKLLTMQVLLAEQVNAQAYSEVFKTMYGQKESEEAEPESEGPLGER